MLADIKRKVDALYGPRCPVGLLTGPKLIRGGMGWWDTPDHPPCGAASLTLAEFKRLVKSIVSEDKHKQEGDMGEEKRYKGPE